mgnify:CR=1 FL=1
MVRIGFIYDFDLTLSEEFQQYPIFREFAAQLKEVHGVSLPEEYWRLCNNSEMGVGWMQQLVKDAKAGVFPNLTNQRMRDHFASQIKLSPGLVTLDGTANWFDRVNEYCQDNGSEGEHHVISVGVHPLIAGTAVFPNLTSLRSGTFNEDDSGIVDIKTIVDPFRKVEDVKSICKGTDLHEDLPLDRYHINYRNVIIFGDGQSDKDMFRYIRQRGGIAVAVFEEGNWQEYRKAIKNLGDSVNIIAPRDYSGGSTLDELIKEHVGKISSEICDMDYDLVHKFLLGQLRNDAVRTVVQGHYQDCGLCQERSELKAYFS